MTNLRLWSVTLESIMVVARTQEEAESVGIGYGVDHNVTDVCLAQSSTAAWEDSIPWGARDPDAPDRTVAQWLELLRDKEAKS